MCMKQCPGNPGKGKRVSWISEKGKICIKHVHVGVSLISSKGEMRIKHVIVSWIFGKGEMFIKHVFHGYP